MAQLTDTYLEHLLTNVLTTVRSSDTHDNPFSNNVITNKTISLQTLTLRGELYFDRSNDSLQITSLPYLSVEHFVGHVSDDVTTFHSAL